MCLNCQLPGKSWALVKYCSTQRIHRNLKCTVDGGKLASPYITQFMVTAAFVRSDMVMVQDKIISRNSETPI